MRRGWFVCVALFFLLQGCHYSLLGKEISFSPALEQDRQQKRVDEYRAWMMRYLAQKGWEGIPPTSKKSEITIFPFRVIHANKRTIYLMVRCRKEKRAEAFAFLNEMVARSRPLFPDVSLLDPAWMGR